MCAFRCECWLGRWCVRSGVRVGLDGGVVLSGESMGSDGGVCVWV